MNMSGANDAKIKLPRMASAVHRSSPIVSTNDVPPQSMTEQSNSHVVTAPQPTIDADATVKKAKQGYPSSKDDMLSKVGPMICPTQLEEKATSVLEEGKKTRYRPSNPRVGVAWVTNGPTLQPNKGNDISLHMTADQATPSSDVAKAKGWRACGHSNVGVAWVSNGPSFVRNKNDDLSPATPLHQDQLVDTTSQHLVSGDVGQDRKCIQQQSDARVKIRRNSGVPIVPSYSATEQLQPGFEFVEWGEYGPPERPTRRPSQIEVQASPSQPTITPSEDSGDDMGDHCVTKPESATPEKRFYRKRWVLGVAAVLILVAIGGVLGVCVFKKNSPSTAASSFVTTQMEPFTASCDLWASQKQPSVITQCLCIGKIAVVADDVIANYQRLVSGGFVQEVLREFAGSIDSCDPVNQALVWLASATGSPVPEANLRQRFIMALLFITWNGRDWTLNDGWMSSDNECIWKGVTCDMIGEAVGLDLYNNQVHGNMGADFPMLTSLEVFSVGLNNMHGSLPSELSSLARLRTLDAQSNQLTGSMPKELAQMTQLVEVNLGNNALRGTIPTWLGKLTNLQTLVLSNNTFNQLGTEAGANATRVTFPTEIGLLTNLGDLELASVGLQGTIPRELFHLTNNLKHLLLGENSLKGTISSLFGNFNAMQELGLEFNSFTGTIPPELVRCTSLAYFYLSNNKLTGTVPTSFGFLNNLRGNLLSGTMPQSVCAVIQPLLCVGEGGIKCNCCVCRK